MTQDQIEKLVAEAVLYYNQMTPKEQAAMWKKQKESWVKAEMELDNEGTRVSK